MSDSFAQGAIAAQEANKGNPFNQILGAFQNAQARRYAEDSQRKKEEADLSKALMTLSYQKNYENELMKAKAEEERKQILLKGQAEGKIAPTEESQAGSFEGTPFGAIGQRFKAINEKAQGKTLVTPMIDRISKGEDAYYTLGDATQKLEVNKDKFSQFMGPGKSALRHPIRSYVNKDLQDFLAWKANVQDAFQQYRVVITGAQASDKEIALLAKNRPTEEDSYDVFTKKAKKVREVGNQVLTRYISNLGKAGYNTSGFQETLENLNKDLSGLKSGDETTNGQFAQPKTQSEYNAIPRGSLYVDTDGQTKRKK